VSQPASGSSVTRSATIAEIKPQNAKRIIRSGSRPGVTSTPAGSIAPAPSRRQPIPAAMLKAASPRPTLPAVIATCRQSRTTTTVQIATADSGIPAAQAAGILRARASR
jgi:hypothetical protein